MSRVSAKPMFMSRTKVPPQKFHARETKLCRGKREREARKNPLLITTKLPENPKKGEVNSLKELTTTQVRAGTFRMMGKGFARLFHRIKGNIIMQRRQTPSKLNLRGTPTAAIISIRPRFQRDVKKSPHDLNIKRPSIKKVPRNLIMRRLAANSRARDTKWRQP